MGPELSADEVAVVSGSGDGCGWAGAWVARPGDESSAGVGDDESGISNLAAAKRFWEDKFLLAFKARLAVVAASTDDLHQPLAAQLDLDQTTSNDALSRGTE